jgi:hypothetical protein
MDLTSTGVCSQPSGICEDNHDLADNSERSADYIYSLLSLGPPLGCALTLSPFGDL